MAVAIERILLVSDNDGQILFWEMLLSEFPFQVYKARTGAEGIETVEKEKIQFVIVAWELSSMPGPVFVQRARSSRKRKRMPFLIYSNRMSPEDVAFSKELNLGHILPLPLNKQAAKDAIQAILDREAQITPVEVKLRAMEDCLAEGRPAEVLKMVGPDVSKRGPQYPRYKCIVAETFLLMGQLDKAYKATHEALEADSDFVQAKYLQARCHTMSGKHDEAIAVLDTLSNSNPRNVQTLIHLGSAYVSADKIDKAKAVVSKVRDLDLDSAETRDIEGKIAIKDGNLPLAAQLLAATENGDEIARFYNSLAVSLVAKGQFDKGIETYQSALKVLANKARVHLLEFNLALAYRKKASLEESLDYLCNSYTREPGFERAYSAIARAVSEFKQQKRTLPMPKLCDVKTARRKYFEANPKVALKVKQRMEARNKKTS